MIRQAEKADLDALSAICLRAKAHWGYDDAFMAACKDELSLKEVGLGPGLALWEDAGTPLGVVQVLVDGDTSELDDLFIDPSAMGKGIGKHLFLWAAEFAREKGAQHMSLTSDPYAEPFYLRMGAKKVGEKPSGSIPGRFLPRLEFPLAPSAQRRG